MPISELDRYLNTLEARMKHLPKARRTDDLREIRSHLETLVAGYQAQGRSEFVMLGLRKHVSGDVVR